MSPRERLPGAPERLRTILEDPLDGRLGHSDPGASSAWSPSVNAEAASESASSASPASFQGPGPAAVTEATSQRPHGERNGYGDRPRHRYWAILTLSLAAACVTCPAIAVAGPARSSRESPPAPG